MGLSSWEVCGRPCSRPTGEKLKESAVLCLWGVLSTRTRLSVRCNGIHECLVRVWLTGLKDSKSREWFIPPGGGSARLLLRGRGWGWRRDRQPNNAWLWSPQPRGLMRDKQRKTALPRMLVFFWGECHQQLRSALRPGESIKPCSPCLSRRAVLWALGIFASFSFWFST